MKRVLAYLFLLSICLAPAGCSGAAGNARWSEAKAARWEARTPWLRGCNYTPSNAINQLEMWQEETFSPELIDKELGWAEELGFNCMRVFLHHLVWEQDRDGFVGRMDRYLEIASSHGIRTMFVFLDDCWDAHAALGPQREPRKGVHNSGWLKDPGALYFGDPTDPDFRVDTAAILGTLERYMKDILTTFGKDRRVVCWDLYNEPGGGAPNRYGERSLPLLRDVFRWAWEVRPSQPLTVAVWTSRFPEISRFVAENSDIISYHTYDPPGEHLDMIENRLPKGRPMICTEYMARPFGSTFQTVMPMLKEKHIGAINWGFVAGKTQTYYPWGSQEGSEEPEVWFHDILRADGTPFSEEEVRIIKLYTGK